MPPNSIYAGLAYMPLEMSNLSTAPLMEPVRDLLAHPCKVRNCPNPGTLQGAGMQATAPWFCTPHHGAWQSYNRGMA